MITMESNIRADGAPGDASRAKGRSQLRHMGVVGFIRFLDCYYLTPDHRRAKVGVLWKRVYD
jgi:hypothetical protein